ncbi:hypothetical protein J3R83DRAFT_3620 [Lanmaoa asiatica]|nr:hypothetical protein J3R83DRAFT_3620 [Lanmaoa asiatica]
MPPSTRAIVCTDAVENEKDVSIIVDGARDGVELSPAERARLLRKVDWHLLPLVSLLYLLSFL